MVYDSDLKDNKDFNWSKICDFQLLGPIVDEVFGLQRTDTVYITTIPVDINHRLSPHPQYLKEQNVPNCNRLEVWLELLTNLRA